MDRHFLKTKFLAPIKFLEMSYVAIEILESGVYFLSLRKSSKGLLPDRFGFINLSPGSFVAGEVINKEEVVKVLTEIRHRTGASFVRFSLPEEKTYIFKTHLPKLKTSEIREVLEFKLEENIPLTARESVFDFDLVPRRKVLGGGIDLIVSATPSSVAETFQEIFDSAGFISLLSSPEAHNVARALVRPDNQQTIVILNIREHKTVLSLVVAGLVFQTTSIALGGRTFTDLIAKSYNLSEEEARKFKHEKLYKETAETAEIFTQVITSLSIIKDELEKFIAYANERGVSHEKVERVILCGRDSMIVGLSQYFGVSTGLPTGIGNIWINNFSLEEHLPEISRVDSLNYASVNGLNLLK